MQSFNAKGQQIQRDFVLTDSSNDDVTAALVAPPILMLARTGAPKPIEESCRLINNTNYFSTEKAS